MVKDDDDDEGNDCEQSDMVALILNIGFMPNAVIEKFEFKKGFHETFKTALIESQKTKE